MRSDEGPEEDSDFGRRGGDSIKGRYSDFISYTILSKMKRDFYSLEEKLTGEEVLTVR